MSEAERERQIQDFAESQGWTAAVQAGFATDPSRMSHGNTNATLGCAQFPPHLLVLVAKTDSQLKAPHQKENPK